MKRFKILALLALVAVPLLSLSLGGCKASADGDGAGVEIGDA